MTQQRVAQIQQIIRQNTASACVLAVTGGKGGSGKTNIAVNLAICLAAEGKRVILLDGDWGLANVDVVMGIESNFSIANVMDGSKTLEQVIQIGPGGVEIICGASGMDAIANMNEFQRQRILAELENLQNSSDTIIIDTAAGIGKSVIGFCTAADHTLVVTTPEPAAMTDAYAMIKVLAMSNYQGRISLIVNMADSMAEGKLVHRQIARVAQQFLGITVCQAAVIVRDEHVGLAVKKRRPVVLAYPKAPVTSSILTLAARLGKGSTVKSGNDGFFRKVANFFF